MTALQPHYKPQKDDIEFIFGCNCVMAPGTRELEAVVQGLWCGVLEETKETLRCRFCPLCALFDFKP